MSDDVDPEFEDDDNWDGALDDDECGRGQIIGDIDDNALIALSKIVDATGTGAEREAVDAALLGDWLTSYQVGLIRSLEISHSADIAKIQAGGAYP